MDQKWIDAMMVWFVPSLCIIDVDLDQGDGTWIKHQENEGFDRDLGESNGTKGFTISLRLTIRYSGNA